MKKNIKEKFNPTLRKNKWNIFKNIFGICFIWFMIFIFTFYMDGETGMILIYFAFFSALVSYLIAFIGRKRIKISLECDEYVQKSKELTVKINVEKTGKLPLAFADIFINSSETFEKSESHFKFSLALQSSESFEYKIKPCVGGNGNICIKNVFSSGFLGIVSYDTDLPVLSKNIGIIPEIPELNTSNSLFRTINDIVVTSDDEEVDSPLSFSANAVAGYEHREYIQGDSLKRINWKLSSKRDKLMVRLDEASASVQPVVIINLTGNNIFTKEKNIQSAFGLLSLFVKQGIGCKVYFKSENNDIRFLMADSQESINNILMTILITPSENITDFDENIFYTEKACAFVIFSPEVPEKLISSTFVRSNKENIHFIVADEQAKNKYSVELWRINSDNNFELV